MNEEWRDIPGYEGLYQVSNLGRVKSLEKIDARGWHRKEKILVQIDNMHGYYQLMLYKNKNKKKISVHRLVALAFIPNPNNYPCVNHKDENPSNNCIENLEWCDDFENRTHAHKNGLRKMEEIIERISKLRSVNGRLINTIIIMGQHKKEELIILILKKELKIQIILK